jgi:hypothetical protein
MTYYDLLAVAQHDPADADYASLRAAYAESDDYAPYVHDQEHLDALRAALPVRNLDAALDAIDGLLDHNYLDIEAHMAADYIYTLLGDQVQSAYHRTFARGLIDAIFATGNGVTFDTAFVVLSIPEEYLVMRLLGFRATGQRLVQHEEHWFDVLSAQRNDDEPDFELHFNIDVPKTWLHHNIAADNEDE